MEGRVTFKSRSTRNRHRQRKLLDADTKWLKWAESRFTAIAGKDTALDRESFKNALEVRNVFFADRFFDLLDIDRNGAISLQEMMDGLFLLTKGTQEEKLRFFFDVFDLDENGSIDRQELRGLLTTGIDESMVKVSDRKLDHMTETLFCAADVDESGSISFGEFIAVLRRYPDLMENCSISAASWLKETRTIEKTSGSHVPYYLTSTFLRNNCQQLILLILFILANGALCGAALNRYLHAPNSNWCFVIARMFGNALNFNCAIVVVMMLRNALSFLRSTWLIDYFPFDDSIQIHKFVGYVILVESLAHTFGHIGNAQTYLNFTAVELLFTDPSILPVGLPVGKLVGTAFITGWILIVVLLILIVGSLSFVRTSGHFEIFFWTHKLCYSAFWILLILHGPKFWAFFIGPAVLFILEKISEMKIIKQFRFGNTYVKEANLLPSGVTHLVLTRQPNFKYKAGDYIFIQIPQLAANEWHPFTISSAPEQTDIVSLHIRSAGNWTKRLYRFFNEIENSEGLEVTYTKKKSVIGSSPVCQANVGGAVNVGYEPDGVEPIVDTVIDIESVDQMIENILAPSVLKIRRVSYTAEIDAQMVLQLRKDHIGKITEVDEDQELETDDKLEDKVVKEYPSEDQETSGNQEIKGDLKNDEDQRTGAEMEAKGDQPIKPSNSVTFSDDVTENNVNSNNGLISPKNSKSRKNGVGSTTVVAKGVAKKISVIDKKISQPKIIFDLKTNSKIKVHIQGPYGTPSTSIFHAEHAVLIGAGIGITPYASIIQSIMHRHRNSLNTCPSCDHSWVDEQRHKHNLVVKKVDFVWLNRNHTAFEWFVDLLLKLEDEQKNNSLGRDFLDIHLFMTGMQRFDMKSVGLQMALDMVHEVDQRDLLTGLRTKLQAGRPDWSTLFTKIKAENKGKISVFFCGAPALGSVISKHCHEFGFVFHKESF